MANSRFPERPTTGPTEGDVNAAAFEREIARLGESKARWSRLMALLEERESANETN